MGRGARAERRDLQPGRQEGAPRLQILKGEPVVRGLAVPSEYIAPADIEQHVEADRPDDWWASTLPEEWKPKS
jgi:hypothetical protein